MQPKRGYRRLQELELMMTRAGVELLLRDGIEGARNITIPRAIEHLGSVGVAVSKGSVLGPDRIWRSQRAYQFDVLRQFISDATSSGSEIAQTLTAVELVLLAADLETLAGRRKTLRELIRVGGEANFRAMTEGRTWTSWLAVWATAATQPADELSKALLGQLGQGDDQMIRDLQDHVYGPMTEIFGMKLRTEFEPDGLTLFAASVLSLADGFALRGPGTRGTHVRINPYDGTPEPWHPFSIGLEALVVQFFEPI